MIKISKVFVEGFGSWVEPQMFEFKTTNGMLSIVGPNGSGKSTILNAIAQTLFGQTFKPKSRVKSYDHLIKRGTCTGVTFSKGNSKYEIYRCISYRGKVNNVKGGNSLLLFVNGEVPDFVGKSKTQVQAYIESVLGYSFSLFRNAIFFGQNSKRFVEESNTDKKAIFEQMFSLEVFNQAKSEASNKVSDLITQISAKGSELDILNSKLRNLREKIESGKEMVDNSDDVKKEYTEMLEEYREEETRLLLKTTELTKYGTIGEQVKRLKREIKEVKEKLQDKNKELDKVKSDISMATGSMSSNRQMKKNLKKSLEKGICAYCNSKNVDQEHVDKEISHLNKKIKGSEELIEKNCNPVKNHLETEIKSIQLELDKKNKELNTYKSKAELLENTQKAFGLQQKNTIKVENLLNNLNGEVEKSSKVVASSKLKILRVKPKLRAISKEIKSLAKDKDMYKWFNDVPLSNRGIKNYVFNMLIGNVNRFLTQYEKFTGIQVEIMIDNESYNKEIHIMVNRRGHLVFFEDLSGGEVQLVNISLLMAMNDVLTSVNPINILVLDEVFESLDASNIEVVYNILLAKSQSVKVILISHIPEIISQYSMEKISLTIKNEVSSVLSY